MPYKDPEKRRAAQRKYVRRRRKAAKAARSKNLPAAPKPVADLAAFLETLTVPLGSHAGETLTLLPWEREFLAGAFAPDVAEAGLTLGRGNGKTALCAGLATASLVGPLAVPRGECVLVASSFTQGKIAFQFVRDYMAPWTDAEPERWRILDSEASARIEDRESGAVVRCIGSDSRRAHGIAGARLVLADEPAQWEPAKSERMYAALSTSAGKVEGFRLVALGTRPASGLGWFARLLDGGPGVFRQVHAAAPDADPFAPETWETANPSLPHFPALREALEREAEKAKLDGAELQTFRALRLNMGVADTETRMLLEPGSWERVEAAELRPARGPMVLGVDLGGASAMTAAAAHWPRTGRLEAAAWFPAVPSLAERGRRDGVGGLYGEIAERGELLTTPGRTVPIAAALRWARETWGLPALVVADRYKEAEMRQALDDADYTGADVVFRGQGYRDGSEDVRAFRRAVLDGKVAAPVSLLMRSALSEAVTAVDTSGNEKLAKAGEGGRRTRARDDVAAAMILAVAEGSRRPARRRKRLRWRVV